MASLTWMPLRETMMTIDSRFFARGFALLAAFAASTVAADAQFGGPVPVLVTSDTANIPNWVKQAADMAKQIDEAKQQITQLQTQIQQQLTQMNPLAGGQSQGWTQQLGSLGGSLAQAPGESQQQTVAGEIVSSSPGDAAYVQSIIQAMNQGQGTTRAVDLNTLMQSATATAVQKQTLLQAAGAASSSADQQDAATILSGMGTGAGATDL